MIPKRYVWNLFYTMKGPVLVEMKSQITAVNIKTKKVIQEHLELDQVLIARSKVKRSRTEDFNLVKT